MSLKSKQIIIAIDGPAGAGKSTIAKALSKALAIPYLDTGAMYRALTLKAMMIKTDLENEQALTALAKQTVINVEMKGDQVRVLLDGKDVSEEIRTVEVTNNTFYVARVPGVREQMVIRQQEIGKTNSLVVEGRDITTVVFPQTPYKFYLDAHFEERALRRFKEFKQKGKEVPQDDVQHDLKTRDDKDFTRSVGALKKAEGAIVIDSTHMSIEEVVAFILKAVTCHG